MVEVSSAKRMWLSAAATSPTRAHATVVVDEPRGDVECGRPRSSSHLKWTAGACEASVRTRSSIEAAQGRRVGWCPSLGQTDPAAVRQGPAFGSIAVGVAASQSARPARTPDHAMSSSAKSL